MHIDSPRSAQLPALRALWQEAFGDTDAFLDGFYATGFSPERCRCLSGEDSLDGALYWFDCLWQSRKIAYIYAVATRQAVRGQGICRRLMEDTHRHLKALGYAGALLVPAEPHLFRLYGKLGYRACCQGRTVTAVTGHAPTPLRQVSPEEYAALQSRFLPQNSVVHTGGALSFAATYCRFYAGEDFLFCAAREKDHLYFQEFLGNTRALAGILRALEVGAGQVFLPGGEQPLAMYHSFSDSPALPDYFGIPLS